MRTGLHPELGVSADDGGRPGAGDHYYPMCSRGAAALAVRGRGATVWLAPPLADFPSSFPAGPASGSLELGARRHAGPESQGGFSALWKWDLESGRHLVQVLGLVVGGASPLLGLRPSPELGTGPSSVACGQADRQPPRVGPVLRALVCRPGGD